MAGRLAKQCPLPASRTFAPMPAPVAPTSLPPLAAAPVPAAARLAYVRQHFARAYDNVPDLAILIGPPGSGAAVEINDNSVDFFNQTLPCPPAPNWREWREKKLPFFFDNSTEKSILTFKSDRVFITTDIISAAFYLLSGWQEYFSPERDRHGRFPLAASVQKQFGFVTIPVVNYYFDILKSAVEHVTGQALRPRRWGPAQAPFAAFITHDVDSLHGGWGTAARYALRQRQPLALLRLLANKLRNRPAPWHNLAHVQAETARYGANSTFFVLAENQPAPNGTPNADYAPAAPALQNHLRQLAAAGAEIGLHSSYGTAAARLATEAARLPAAPAGNRFHYLAWEPRTTPAAVAAAGFTYDSTLGFAEHFGFRNSYCLPFFPWNFEQNKAHEFLEIPLTLMDTTLNHPYYLQLTPAQIVPAVMPVLAEIKSFGGVFTLLWHNANFDPLNTLNGPMQFHEIMAALLQNKAAFLRGNEIAQALLEK